MEIFQKVREGEEFDIFDKSKPDEKIAIYENPFAPHREVGYEVVKKGPDGEIIDYVDFVTGPRSEDELYEIINKWTIRLSEGDVIVLRKIPTYKARIG